MRTLNKTARMGFLPSLLDEIMRIDNVAPKAANRTPRVNVTETKADYEIDMLVPGFAKKDLDINVVNNNLEIKAEVSQEVTNEDNTSLRREFVQKSFKRTFSLPENVDIDNIKANCENGILKVRVPKAEVKEEVATKVEIA